MIKMMVNQDSQSNSPNTLRHESTLAPKAVVAQHHQNHKENQILQARGNRPQSKVKMSNGNNQMSPEKKSPTSPPNQNRLLIEFGDAVSKKSLPKDKDEDPNPLSLTNNTPASKTRVY